MAPGNEAHRIKVLVCCSCSLLPRGLFPSSRDRLKGSCRRRGVPEFQSWAGPMGSSNPHPHLHTQGTEAKGRPWLVDMWPVSDKSPLLGGLSLITPTRGTPSYPLTHDSVLLSLPLSDVSSLFAYILWPAAPTHRAKSSLTTGTCLPCVHGSPAGVSTQ